MRRRMRVDFIKMHGLGNDFVVVDARKDPFALDDGRAVPNDDSVTLSTEPYMPGTAGPDPPDTSPGF